MAATPVVIELTTLQHIEGGPRGKFDPYLWVVFFKFDGATVFAESSPQGLQLRLRVASVAEFSLGSQRNLGGKDIVRHGEAIAIPDNFGGKPLGRWPRSLEPIVLRAGRRTLPTRLAPVVGLIYVVIEEDASSNATAESAHKAFNSAIAAALDEVVLAGVNEQGSELDNPTLSPEQQRAIAAQVEASVFASALRAAIAERDVGTLFNADDFLFSDAEVFTLPELAATSSSQPKAFSSGQKDTGKNGSWQMNGRVFLGTLDDDDSVSREDVLGTREPGVEPDDADNKRHRCEADPETSS